MIKKYNIALTPLSQSERIIKLANKLSHVADKYLLGYHSLPHVTLYQFMLDDREIANCWGKVTATFNEQNINLIFNEFSCVTFDNDTFWVSLMPNNRDLLIKSHYFVANIINMPIRELYDPHMSLINTKNKEYAKELKEPIDHYVPIKDIFTLSLGECDEIGQFTKLLYSCEVGNKIQYNN